MQSLIFLAPSANFTQTTLNGAITNSASSITLNSVTNLQSPGYIVIDRTDSNGISTPSNRELVYYTGISGNQLTGCVRGADQSTPRTHADGAVVETTPTVGMWNSLATIVSQGFDGNGLLNAIVSPVSLSNLFIPTRLDVSQASVTGLGLSPVFVGGGFYSGPTIAIGGLLIAPRPATLSWVSAVTKYVASGASIGFDFKLRGASIFSNPTTRPAIAAGGTFVSTASINVKNINPGDILQGDVDSVGANGIIQEVTIQAGSL